MGIEYDTELGQYTARDNEGREVYGETFTACAIRLGEANQTIAKHKAANPETEQIVLEVVGYARGRQLLDKRLASVRVNGNAARPATNPDFDNALAWLMGEGYELAGQTKPATTMGTATVRYTYQRTAA